MRLPPLSVLRSFEAAARHQSFTRAAEELRVTQAAVSRKVREMERHVGVTLFRKAGRGVALTEAGRALGARLRGDLARLGATIDHASAAGDDRRTLCVAALPTFSARWLAPRLGGFLACHPAVQLSLVSRSCPFDLIAEGVDVAVHFGRADWPGARLEPLCPEHLLAVAAPSLASRHGLTAGADPRGAPLLHLATRREAWADHLRTCGTDASAALRGPVFDQFAAMIAAAVHGLGAAIVPSYLVEEELAERKLVAFAEPAAQDALYHVAVPRNVEDPAARAFTDWIRAEADRSVARRAAGSS